MMPENGTVLDIAKWMRGLAESHGTKRRVNIPTLTVRSWLGLCQALEEAARRDNKAARDAIYREAEKNARKAVAGNVAALRNALTRILQSFAAEHYGEEGALSTGEIFKLAQDALSTPARNCDLCKTKQEAWLAWAAACEEALQDKRPLPLFHNWLFFHEGRTK